MAAAAHVSVSLYGIVEGNAPFQDATGATAFSRLKEFPKPGVASLPTTGTVFHPLQNGYPVTTLNGNFYVYSVIEVQPTGLNTHGVKYVSDMSVATLATNAG
jgi:hypothetical protein